MWNNDFISGAIFLIGSQVAIYFALLIISKLI